MDLENRHNLQFLIPIPCIIDPKTSVLRLDKINLCPG